MVFRITKKKNKYLFYKRCGRRKTEVRVQEGNNTKQRLPLRLVSFVEVKKVIGLNLVISDFLSRYPLTSWSVGAVIRVQLVLTYMYNLKDT